MIQDDIIEVLDQFIEAEAILQREKALLQLIRQMEKRVGKIFIKQGRLFLEIFKKNKSLFEKIAESEQNSYNLNGTRLLIEATKNKELIQKTAWELNMEVERMMARVEETIRWEMVDVVNKGISQSIEKGFNNGVSYLDIEYAFNVKHPRAINYINKRGAELVTKINETTRSEIKRIVTNGIEKGLSYDQTAKEISKRFSEFAIGKPQLHIRSRAHLVAVTEAGNAYETGNYEAGKQLQEAGIMLEKYWATVGDNRVSDGCSANEGQGWIPYDEAFESGHEHPLRFPGCRCALLTRRKGE